MFLKAVRGDIPAMEAIYQSAREFMHSHGNPGQWTGGYPQREVVEGDIAAGVLYVYKEDDIIQNVFRFAVEDDPTYRSIDGCWISGGPYGVIHRIASAKRGHGYARRAIDYCFKQCGNLRIDTHTDNLPMRRLLADMGFLECGTILLADGSPRVAYQKI